MLLRPRTRTRARLTAGLRLQLSLHFGERLHLALRSPRLEMTGTARPGRCGESLSWAARLPKNKTAWHSVARASRRDLQAKRSAKSKLDFSDGAQERADEARRPNSSVPLLDWRVEYDGLVPRLLLRLRVLKLLGGAAERSRIGSGKGPNRKNRQRPDRGHSAVAGPHRESVRRDAFRPDLDDHHEVFWLVIIASGIKSRQACVDASQRRRLQGRPVRWSGSAGSGYRQAAAAFSAGYRN
jgi:hypothetical protein